MGLGSTGRSLQDLLTLKDHLFLKPAFSSGKLGVGGLHQITPVHGAALLMFSLARHHGVGQLQAICIHFLSITIKA